MADRESTSITTSSRPRPSDREASALSSQDASTSFLAILRFDPDSFRRYRQTLKLRSERAALATLARAIAASPGWPESARFVLRTAPSPVLGILGRDGTFESVALQAQARACEEALGRLHYVGYREAGKEVERLAAVLAARFGAEALRRFSYVAIPRGGLIVLGLLAACLGIPAERVGAAPPPDAEPLVVVDDCALSGGRFGAFLKECPAPRVVFAHLFSHPDLRAAIRAREARVLDCIAARDLRDEGPERLGASWGEARERWTRRLATDRYWLGDCERIAFPWNEPDRLLWNPRTQEVDLGWKLVPPELCLKRTPGRDAGTRVPIQVQPRGAGPWHPAPTVLFAWRRGATLACRIDSGEVFRLSATAHDMWWALLRGGAPAPALRLLRERYRIAEETLAADLSGFLANLQARGLFTRETS